jgi:hypothetical protein
LILSGVFFVQVKKGDDSLIRRIRFRLFRDNRSFPSRLIQQLEKSLYVFTRGEGFDLNPFFEHWGFLDFILDGNDRLSRFWDFLPKFVGSNTTIPTLTVSDS